MFLEKNLSSETFACEPVICLNKRCSIYLWFLNHSIPVQNIAISFALISCNLVRASREAVPYMIIIPSVPSKLFQLYQNLDVSRHYLVGRYIQILPKLRQFWWDGGSIKLLKACLQMSTCELDYSNFFLSLLLFLHITFKKSFLTYACQSDCLLGC
jgi:hypothetical protein